MLAFFAGEVPANAMPQIQLPIFPASSTAITSELAFEQRDGQVYYFNGHFPVFTHPVEDIASFRFFTRQLIANGSASQSQISKAFGVPLVTVKRACKKLRLRSPKIGLSDNLKPENDWLERRCGAVGGFANW